MAFPESLKIIQMVPSADPQRGVDFIREDGSIIPGPIRHEVEDAIAESEKEMKRLAIERHRTRVPFDSKSYNSPLI